MRICYFDESGDSSQPVSFFPPSNIQPIFAVVGVFIDAGNLHQLTRGFIDLKTRFHPGLLTKGSAYLSRLKTEIKGSAVRRDFRNDNRKQWKTHIQFLSGVIKLLEVVDAKIVSRIVIKSPTKPFVGKNVYTSTVQKVCSDFNRFLSDVDDHGIVIADHRNPTDDKSVAFSVGTQKFQRSGDAYGRIVECPTFGCSEVHAGIQIADLLVSTIINPIASYVYCLPSYTSVHVSTHYRIIQQKLAMPIKKVCYRYQDAEGRWRGGITVNDTISGKSASNFFA